VIEGVLQTVWNRALSHKPVLLIIIGSNLGVMDHLSDYSRPFYQRGVEIKLAPLNPLEVGRLTGLPPADAFDAYLITGGLPPICQEWREGESRAHFLARILQNPTRHCTGSRSRSSAAGAVGAAGPSNR
jgi:uncharacterized protein